MNRRWIGQVQLMRCTACFAEVITNNTGALLLTLNPAGELPIVSSNSGTQAPTFSLQISFIFDLESKVLLPST